MAATADLGLAKHLSQNGLIAICWTGVGASAILLGGRTVIRVWRIRELRADDYFIWAAFVVLIVNAALQTRQAQDAYYLARLRAGLEPFDQETVERVMNYLKYEFTIIGLFWTVLWLVKASFLAFYYKLTQGLKVYRRVWWAVVVFSFLAYVGCWISSAYTCHPPKNYFKFGACIKKEDQRGSVISIAYSTTVDILTDVLIMAMPINLIWKVKISTKEKIGLAGVFSLGLIIIIFAIIRAVQITYTARTDSILLELWGIIESSVSVMVGCLPPYKSLFANREVTIPYSGSRGYGSRQANSGGSRRKGNSSVPLQSLTNSDSTTTNIKSMKAYRQGPRSESREEMMDPTEYEYKKSIMVRREVSVSSHGIY